MTMLYYLIPLAAALLLPSRQWLAEFAAIFLPLMIWAGASGGYASPLSILMAFACGLALRNTARATHRMLSRRGGLLAILMAGTAGFYLLPGSMAGGITEAGHVVSAKYRDWEMRQPSETCLANTYPVALGDAVFRLPASPVITIYGGKNTYHLQSSQGMRSLCEKSGKTSAPLQAASLGFDFTIAVRGPFCRVTRSNWNMDLCSGPAAAAGSYPAMLNLYPPQASEPGTHARFSIGRDRANAAGHPFALETSGGFDRYADGYWVAQDGSWKNDAGEPYTLKCQPAAQSGILSCATRYRLKSGAWLSYAFHAPAGKVESVARNMDLNIHLLLAEMAAK